MTWQEEIKDLFSEATADEIEEVLLRLKRLKKTRGDIAYRALAKAVARVREDPDFFGAEGNLPGAGNECGIHTTFTGLVVKIRNRQYDERTRTPTKTS